MKPAAGKGRLTRLAQAKIYDKVKSLTRRFCDSFCLQLIA